MAAERPNVKPHEEGDGDEKADDPPRAFRRVSLRVTVAPSWGRPRGRYLAPSHLPHGLRSARPGSPTIRHLAAYRASEWSDLFVATAGASAALAGLVFVAVSINVNRIVSLAGLPERALASVLLLLSVVLVSIIGLIPGQSDRALGIELLGEAIVLGVVIFLLERRSLERSTVPPPSLAGRAVTIALGTLPFVVGGASVIAGVGGGLYWTAGGMLAAIAGGVVNAWVLLVEILR